MIKVVTVDDSSIVVERLSGILGEIEHVTYLGNAFTISFARKLIHTLQPDVVILDIHITEDETGQNGIDLLLELRQNYLRMKIVIFTNHVEQHYRHFCLEKGADYFFDKSNDSHKISEVLKQWMTGK